MVCSANKSQAKQINRPLPSSKALTFKMRLGAQPFLWKWVLFAWEWKMISISKAEHLYPRFEIAARGNPENMAYCPKLALVKPQSGDERLHIIIILIILSLPRQFHVQHATVQHACVLFFQGDKTCNPLLWGSKWVNILNNHNRVLFYPYELLMLQLTSL